LHGAGFGDPVGLAARPLIRGRAVEADRAHNAERLRVDRRRRLVVEIEDPDVFGVRDDDVGREADRDVGDDASALRIDHGDRVRQELHGFRRCRSRRDQHCADRCRGG